MFSTRWNLKCWNLNWRNDGRLRKWMSHLNSIKLFLLQTTFRLNNWVVDDEPFLNGWNFNQSYYLLTILLIVFRLNIDWVLIMYLLMVMLNDWNIHSYPWQTSSTLKLASIHGKVMKSFAVFVICSFKIFLHLKSNLSNIIEYISYHISPSFPHFYFLIHHPMRSITPQCTHSPTHSPPLLTTHSLTRFLPHELQLHSHLTLHHPRRKKSLLSKPYVCGLIRYSR